MLNIQRFCPSLLLWPMPFRCAGRNYMGLSCLCKGPAL